MRKAVAYYRVSTQRQGKSGLGLKAQKEAVHAYMRGLPIDLVNEFIEIETGETDKRPMLQKALRCCTRNKTVLIIAKLDRLSRNVIFISTLMDSQVEFVAVDYPQASRLLLHIMAAFAEHERELISTRTKEALQAAKGKGVELGKHGKQVLAKRNKRKADIFAKRLRPLLTTLIAEGHTSVRAVTMELNKREVPTFRPGSRWHKTSVHNIFVRLQMNTRDYMPSMVLASKSLIPSPVYITQFVSTEINASFDKSL